MHFTNDTIQKYLVLKNFIFSSIFRFLYFKKVMWTSIYCI